MPVTPEIGCVQGLLWCYTHERMDQIDLEHVGRQLLQRGYRDLTEQIWIRVFLHPEQHRILVVPRTRRVQLRLHYMLPQIQRPVVAYLLSQELDDALGLKESSP